MPITYEGRAMADDAKSTPAKAEPAKAAPSASAKTASKPAEPAMAAEPDLDHEQGPAAQQLHPQLQPGE